jgi:hypothetical protein
MKGSPSGGLLVGLVDLLGFTMHQSPRNWTLTFATAKSIYAPPLLVIGVGRWKEAGQVGDGHAVAALELTHLFAALIGSI